MKHFLTVLCLLLALNCALSAETTEGDICQVFFDNAKVACVVPVFKEPCAEVNKGFDAVVKLIIEGKSKVCELPGISSLCLACKASKLAEATGDAAPAAAPAVRLYHK